MTSGRKKIFDVLTLFPDIFNGFTKESIVHRAIEAGLTEISLDNIRDYSTDRHKTVDDYPYGGSSGMVLKPEPLARAITNAKKKRPAYDSCVIYLSPQGTRLTHSVVTQLMQIDHLILLCGRYKDIDYRIRQQYVDREISIGDYVLSGGEIPAMVVMEAIIRLIPGAIGNRDSAENDSFYSGRLDSYYYTRPETFEGMQVPEILRSGNHEKIRQWHLDTAREMTVSRRPDLNKTD